MSPSGIQLVRNCDDVMSVVTFVLCVSVVMIGFEMSMYNVSEDAQLRVCVVVMAPWMLARQTNVNLTTINNSAVCKSNLLTPYPFSLFPSSSSSPLQRGEVLLSPSSFEPSDCDYVSLYLLQHQQISHQ